MRRKRVLSEVAEQSAEEVEPPASSGDAAVVLPDGFIQPTVSLQALAAPMQKNPHRARAKLRFISPITAKFPINPKTNAFRQEFFPTVSLHEWSDWRWQLRNRIQTLSALKKIIHLCEDELDALTTHKAPLPLAITP